MKFCPVDPEICRGQVHVPRKKRKKERKKERKRRRIIIIIIIRNGAKTISLQTLFGRLNYFVFSIFIILVMTVTFLHSTFQKCMCAPSKITISSCLLNNKIYLM
jgi:hypothetical protein